MTVRIPFDQDPEATLKSLKFWRRWTIVFAVAGAVSTTIQLIPLADDLPWVRLIEHSFGVLLGGFAGFSLHEWITHESRLAGLS